MCTWQPHRIPIRCILLVTFWQTLAAEPADLHHTITPAFLGPARTHKVHGWLLRWLVDY
jgi:hypothetical protein